MKNYTFTNVTIANGSTVGPTYSNMNLNGEIISNSTGTLNALFYPNEADFNVQYSLLSSL